MLNYLYSKFCNLADNASCHTNQKVTNVKSTHHPRVPTIYHSIHAFLHSTTQSTRKNNPLTNPHINLIFIMVKSTFFSSYSERAREFVQEEMEDWDQDVSDDIQDVDEDDTRPRKKMVHRDQEAANAQLISDYLCPDSTYDEETFQCQFQMPSQMFEDICTRLAQHDKYWEQRRVSFLSLDLALSLLFIMSLYRIIQEDWAFQPSRRSLHLFASLPMGYLRILQMNI